MPERNGRDIFNEPIEVKCSAFHEALRIRQVLGRNYFGIKPLDFGMKCGASITEGAMPTEVSILRYGVNSTHPRPKAARFFYVAASSGLEGAPKVDDGSV